MNYKQSRSFQGFKSLILAMVFACTPLLHAAESDSDIETGADARPAKPRWVINAGIFANISPAYQASDQSSSRVIPFVFPIYNGESIQVGEGGMRVSAVKEKVFEIDGSVGGAFPADSDNIEVRRGLPDLNFLVAIGPQLVIHLHPLLGYNNPIHNTDFRLQTRAVFSTDFSRIDSRGYVLEPNLKYTYEPNKQLGIKFNLELASQFATEALHDYFYQVEPEFETATRPAYNAKGGYLGSQVGFSVSYRFTTAFRIISGIKVNLHQGAANEKSPLFRRDVTTSATIGLIYRLYASKT